MIKVDARKINMLRREIFMSKKYKVVTGKPLLEDAQQEQQLCRDSHTAVGSLLGLRTLGRTSPPGSLSPMRSALPLG